LEQLLNFFFVFFIGFLGFLLFSRLKVPVPGFLGSFFATGALNIAGYYPEFNVKTVSFLAQAATGVMIGRQINREFFTNVKGISVSILIASAGMLVLSLVTGYTVYILSDAPLTTALIGGAMGGIAEMTTFGVSMGAEPVTILFMLIFRLVIAVASSYWVVLFISRMIPGKIAKPLSKHSGGELYFRKRDYVPLAGVAFAGAWLFRALGVPNGVMLGAMLFCGVLSVCIRRTYKFEMSIRHITLIALGLAIASNVTQDVVGELHRLLLPGLISSLVSLAGSTLVALILYKTSPMDIVTCVLCTSPAGLTQATFLSEEMGADSLTTSIFQSCRLLGIIAFYPWIVIAIV